MTKRKCIGVTILLCFAAATSFGIEVFNRPGNGVGDLHQSATWDPDGSDYDIFAYDSFRITRNEAITEVRWRGGGVPAAQVNNFKITIYDSIAGGSQPYCGLPSESETIYLYRGWSNGNANQTYVGMVGSTAMYSYSYRLGTPFMAQANVKYWLKVEAWTSSFPFWGVEGSNAENSSHFRFVRGYHMFQNGTGDLAFSLSTDAESSVPYTYSIVSGLYFGGSLGSLAADDNDKLLVMLDEFSPNSEIQFTAHARTSNPATMKLQGVVASSRSDVISYSEIYDLSTSNWVQLDVRIVNPVDSTFVAVVPSPLGRFIDIGQDIRTRIRSIPTADIDAADGWTFAIDRWVIEN
jgi:hypothetical protein